MRRRAHEILLDLFNVVPPTPEQARLTALAANAAGDVADSYYYMSEYHIMSGDLPLAINQLQLALAVPKITSVQRARFQARLEEVQAGDAQARAARSCHRSALSNERRVRSLDDGRIAAYVRASTVWSGVGKRLRKPSREMSCYNAARVVAQQPGICQSTQDCLLAMSLPTGWRLCALARDRADCCSPRHRRLRQHPWPHAQRRSAGRA